VSTLTPSEAETHNPKKEEKMEQMRNNNKRPGSETMENPNLSSSKCSTFSTGRHFTPPGIIQTNGRTNARQQNGDDSRSSGHSSVGGPRSSQHYTAKKGIGKQQRATLRDPLNRTGQRSVNRGNEGM